MSLVDLAHDLIEDWRRSEEFMKSPKGAIEVHKASICPFTMSYLLLGHRKFEKETPTPKVLISSQSDGYQRAEYTLPVDLLKLGGYPADAIDDIAEITIEYQKKL